MAATYAGLAGVFTAIFFLYMVAVLLLFGAEFNAALEPPARRHDRLSDRSGVADGDRCGGGAGERRFHGGMEFARAVGLDHGAAEAGGAGVLGRQTAAVVGERR